MRMFRICYCKKICLFFVLPKFKFAILEKCSFLADLFAKKKNPPQIPTNFYTNLHEILVYFYPEK